MPNGVGVYVLVMSPAAGYKDRAPMSGLGDAGVVKGCGSRYVSEGVRFRLVEPPIVDAAERPDAAADALLRELLTGPEPPTRDDPQRLSLLRNLVAHRLLASEDLRGRFRRSAQRAIRFPGRVRWCRARRQHDAGRARRLRRPARPAVLDIRRRAVPGPVGGATRAAGTCDPGLRTVRHVSAPGGRGRAPAPVPRAVPRAWSTRKSRLPT
ncbi:MAG: hypothetical protein MZW92_40825 [Comamonadaceae bacterium]|nr:hypothetical protein [Comamonadaceae bacterium]